MGAYPPMHTSAWCASVPARTIRPFRFQHLKPSGDALRGSDILARPQCPQCLEIGRRAAKRLVTWMTAMSPRPSVRVAVATDRTRCALVLRNAAGDLRLVAAAQVRGLSRWAFPYRAPAIRSRRMRHRRGCPSAITKNALVGPHNCVAEGFGHPEGNGQCVSPPTTSFDRIARS